MKELLIERCKQLAVYLLETYGEFFPFAFGIIDGAVVSVADDSPDEHPESTTVIADLEKTYRLLYEEGHKFSAVCICVDVVITDPETGKKTDELQIRIHISGDRPIDCYVAYEINSGKVVLSTVYETPGSFSFFRHVQ